MEPPPTALLIVDHGSRRAEANELLHELARAVRDRSAEAYVAVEPAHMELAEPTIAAAFNRCVEAGARNVIISLFFLSPGRHSQQDIPDLVAEAAEQHPGVEWRMTTPLGVAPGIADLLLEQARTIE